MSAQSTRKPSESRRDAVIPAVWSRGSGALLAYCQKSVLLRPSHHPAGGTCDPLKSAPRPDWEHTPARAYFLLQRDRGSALNKRQPEFALNPTWRGNRNFRPLKSIKVVALVMVSISLIGCVRLGNRGFEWGNFLGWLPEFPESYSGRIVESPVRCGNYAARFEYRPGDEAWTGGYRSEVSESFGKAVFNEPVWYAFSTYIADSFRGEAVISQWHASPDAGEVWRSPPLALRYDGEILRVTGRYSEIPIQQGNDAPEHNLYVTPLDKETWNDWVFRVVWSHESGSVDAWLNGTKVIEYRGPIGYRDRRGPFFKFGIYNQGVPHQQVVYHDEYYRSDDPLPFRPC